MMGLCFMFWDEVFLEVVCFVFNRDLYFFS